MQRAIAAESESDWAAWFKDLLAQAVNLVFESVSGDPDGAIQAAEQFPSTTKGIDAWIDKQAAQAAAAASIYIIPFIHLKALVPEVAVVFNRMSQCAWGVGHLQGCVIDGKADLEVVMAIWSDAISSDQIDSALRQAHRHGLLVLDVSGLHARPELGAFLVSGEDSPSPVAVTDTLMRATMARKIAIKVATKLLPKFAVKASVGVLSVIGAIVISKMNRAFVRDFGSAARSYYRAKRHLRDSMMEEMPRGVR